MRPIFGVARRNATLFGRTGRWTAGPSGGGRRAGAAAHAAFLRHLLADLLGERLCLLLLAARAELLGLLILLGFLRLRQLLARKRRLELGKLVAAIRADRERRWAQEREDGSGTDERFHHGFLQGLPGQRRPVSSPKVLSSAVVPLADPARDHDFGTARHPARPRSAPHRHRPGTIPA